MPLVRTAAAPQLFHRRPARALAKRPRSDVRRFGRGRQWQLAQTPVRHRSPIGRDLKLFAMTFLGGFLFVSILIG
jgi:hypothetical protein